MCRIYQRVQNNFVRVAALRELDETIVTYNEILGVTPANLGALEEVGESLVESSTHR